MQQVLGDRDPNGPPGGGGRGSRASNISAMSAGTSRVPVDPEAPRDKQNALPASIRAMTRGSIEMGNLGGALGDGIGNPSRASNRRHAPSRMSTASSQSAYSTQTNQHSRRRPPSSNAQREPMPPMPTVPQYFADTRPPATMPHGSSPMVLGSFPMVPYPNYHDPDSQRASSITHSMQVQPPAIRAANSRSTGNLRGYEPTPRSHGSQSRYLHPGQQSASSQWFDRPGSNPRRAQTPVDQGYGYGYPSSLGRPRVPSDASMGYGDRGFDVPQQSNRGAPHYSYSMPGDQDVPPVPRIDSRYQQVRPMPLNMYASNEHVRVKRSVKGSASSGSTNVRTDSDPPSSDMAFPPTPRNGTPLNAFSRPSGIRMMTGSTTTTGGLRRPDSPEYYDGSEQWETNPHVKPEAELMPPHLNIRRRKRVETVNYNIPPKNVRSARSYKKSAETNALEHAGIAELPASPVGRPITRELVHQGLGASSTTGDVDSSISSPPMAGNTDTIHQAREEAAIRRMGDQLRNSAIPPAGYDVTQLSNLSQMDAGLIDSSTIDFAVRCSIPAMTESGQSKQDETNSASASTAPGSPEKNTDDGMSELLAGYQHTDTKQEDESMSDDEKAGSPKTMENNDSEKDSNHAQKSSGEQSFKSCTDAVESAALPESNKAAGVGEPGRAASSESRHAATDSDARSFRTHNNVVTPVFTNSMPPPRLPSSNLDVEVPAKQSMTGSSSPLQRIKKNFEASSFSSKLRGSSKLSMKQGSVSMSGSSSTLSTSQPPIVPPRESSASEEAQRVNQVSSFLMRAGLPFRRKNKKTTLEENTAVKDSVDNITGQPEQRSGSMSLSETLTRPEELDNALTTEQAVVQQDSVPERPAVSDPVECPSPTNTLRVGLTLVPAIHHHSFSSPIAGILGTSSVYSPQDISLRGRTHSSPAGVPMSSEHNHRDSRSTTHLSWVGRKPLGVPPTSNSEPHLALPSVQEDTTTDLKYPVYRYNAPQRYLHDLKEDSHEDSSLNTSASNLKNSNFRFPPSTSFGIRTSVDDPGVLGCKSSMGSRRASVIEDVHGLPFLEFSEANLYDKFKSALPEDVRFSRSSARAQIDVPDGVVGLLDLVAPEKLQGPVNSAHQENLPRVSIQSPGVINFSRLRCRSSSEKLMAEIDRVSIPSITQLTQRVGEMFPSLSLVDHHEREESLGGTMEFPEEEEIMEHAMEEIHHVHPPSQKRSSARLRPVRGSSALMVVDDDVFEEISSKERLTGSMGDNCVGALGFEVQVGEAGTRAKGKGKTTTRTLSRPLSTVDELQVPSPAVLHPRTAHDQSLRTSIDSALSSLTRSPRSFVSTPTATETRPWNSDKNYPWSTSTNPSVDISLPPQTSLKQSPRPGPSHLRNALSDATSSTFTSVHTPTHSRYGNASGSNANRQAHRLSIFGRSGDQVHAVGERYPTSALSPPTAIFRDNLSSCDISDDEEFATSRKPNRLTLRKRFSSAARNTTRGHTSPRAARSKVNPAEIVSPAQENENSSSTLQDLVGEARAFTSNRHTFRDAQGMPIGAYHRHRIVDSIKRWWHKGGELIRTISRRGNDQQDVVPARD
ncbi:hypothetical protein HBI55_106890 [Parastagonospora nodorum]|nr:hypothetical protein HBI76_241250 [Parastagonospora nodorum]KAH5077752.1 hypothetical protein HBH95_104660 [Parastagonospora nodorum]KAH5635467.1 hypothetical protein HBI51_171050 [Parastagonospora nodorum]KAH6301394.1 hypothetical protein HBI39_125270 [Parastagonospora nodorum]KAH6393892.1 hypothetical protein HBI60_141500 [Parastagonospora nodorum]